MISKRATGFIHALLAYSCWGLFPIYWKAFGNVSSVEIVSHRVIWSLVLLVILVVVLRQTTELKAVLRRPARLAMLFLTATFLSVNWGLFIYSVNSAQIVEASLGYFLNPLVSILLGYVFLKERLTRFQILAVLIAICGVAHFGWHVGRPPWIALSLAITFAFYGLVRKVIAVTPLVGLLVETLLMCPVALGLIYVLTMRGQVGFDDSPRLTLLFIGAGIVTTLPLFWFNSAAKLLPLSTMGFLQYLAPTLQLLVGVILFREPFTSREGISFLLIWTAIAIYLCTLIRSKAPSVPVPNTD